jgi:hypothetical protein
MKLKKKYCFNEQYFVGRGIVVSKKDPKNPCEFKKKNLRKPEQTVLACT